MEKKPLYKDILSFLTPKPLSDDKVKKELKLRPESLKVFTDDNEIAPKIFKTLSRIMNIELICNVYSGINITEVFENFKSDSHPNRLLALQNFFWCNSNDGEILSKMLFRYCKYIQQLRSSGNYSCNILFVNPTLKLIYELLTIEKENSDLLLKNKFNFYDLYYKGEIDNIGFLREQALDDAIIENLFIKGTDVLDPKYGYSFNHLLRYFAVINSNIEIFSKKSNFTEDDLKIYISTNEIFIQSYDSEQLFKKLSK